VDVEIDVEVDVDVDVEVDVDESSYNVESPRSTNKWAVQEHVRT
jgi:hypothetical protein